MVCNSAVVINVTRNNVVECQHRASVVVVDAEGKIVLSAGPCSRMTYLRSLAKPFQVLPLFDTGAVHRFELSAADLAIIVSSHNGENVHVNQVRSILCKAGLPDDSLQCGTHPPYFFAIAQTILAEYGTVQPIHNNCSGKHAGMILLAKQLDLSLESYTRPEHPVQNIILDRLLGLLDLRLEDIAIGVDGCGVPTIAVPFFTIACLYATLATAQEATYLRVVRDAMMQNPRLIAGTGRMETALMSRTPLVAKSGADGLMAVAIPSKGWGVVVKADRGSPVIADMVTLSALRKLDCIPELDLIALQSYSDPPVLNCRGETVGNYQLIWP